MVFPLLSVGWSSIYIWQDNSERKKGLAFLLQAEHIKTEKADRMKMEEKNICLRARETLSETVSGFARATGRMISTIHRRESGTKIPHHSRILYRLLILMKAAGQDAMDVIERIPADETSESRLMAELVIKCVDSGTRGLVILAFRMDGKPEVLE